MRRLLAPILLLLLTARPDLGFAQDFNPGGRQTRPPPGQPDFKRPARPDTKKGPSVDALIQRYTGIVMSQPGQPFPLQKLTQLYRERDGKLDKLIEEFEQRAKTAGAEQLNAQLALAGIYRHAHRQADAQRLLDEAVKARPKLAVPRLMLAELAESEGDKAAARSHYEAALPLQKKGVEQERTIRTLMVLCLDLKDFQAAEKYHERLVNASGGSLFVKKELGRELLSRGEHVRAEQEFRKIVKASAGDNRALAPALRDLGTALAKQKKLDEALEVLKRARHIAGSQAGIRREILYLLTDVFREQGKLIELISILETEPTKDFEQLAIIGALYEETGQVDKALKTYREALKLDPQHADTRVRLVHLLQTAGQLDEAIAEYERLIKAAPHNPDFVFELAETLIQRGDRAKALKLVADLERRTASEGDILAAIADFYEQIEEPQRAVKVLEQLAKLPSGDAQYIKDLGDRYFQEGDKKKALATWARIKTIVQNRARAAAELGEVYLDHDMPDEALKELREAVKLAPGQVRYKKALAIALERTALASSNSRYRYSEALSMWETVLAEAGDNQLLSREARTHIVSLWSIQRQLQDKIGPLTAKLNHSPPDLTAGRLLAEVQRRLRKLDDAEKTLRVLTKHAPGDESTWLTLEQVLVMRRDLDGAIAVLKRLVEVNPRRARQYYQRMSQYSAELYRDDDAIEYAAQAVELSPNDAVGHHSLGKMYARRQDTTRAIAEYRKAIQQNDRLFPAYFDLAELLLSAGQVEEADLLYRRVVRTSRDEELVVRAARASMQINLGKGTLESLERELLPVALGNPQKPLYRRLLVELYGAMTFPLVHAARLGSSTAAEDARRQLAKIGARAVKPLLDALADSKHSQQRIAIEVLAYVQNRGAGPALFSFATGQADPELRVRAMVATGALSDPALLPRYQQLLAPAEDAAGLVSGDVVAVAAAWGVARMRSPKAEPLLRRLLQSTSPDVRALGAIGLGLSRNKQDAEVLATLARSPQSGPLTRAAAVHALGELGYEEQRPLLLALTDSSETSVRLAALLALAQLSPGQDEADKDDVGMILARALLAEQPEIRKTAMAAATALGTGSYRRGDTLPVPDGTVVVADVLRSRTPTDYRAAEQAQALIALKPLLTKAAVAAVATSPERARIVSEITFGKLRPLIDAPAGEELPAAVQAQLSDTSEAVAAASVNGFIALARHPSDKIRKQAVEFLARRGEREAQAAVVAALSESDPEVCKTALAAVGTVDDPATTAAVVGLLQRAESWSIRARAATALSRIRPGSAAAQSSRIDEALAQTATADPYALVREAAIRTVASRKSATAKSVLAKVTSGDEEPRLRQLAAELAAKL